MIYGTPSSRLIYVQLEFYMYRRVKKKYFKKIIAKNFYKLDGNINAQIKES